MAGLEYLALVPLSFCILALAPAAVFSATIAMEILYHGAALSGFIASIIFFVVSVTIAIHLPLLAFTPMMIRARARAITRFGGLIQYHNNLYKEKWLEGKLPAGDSILPSPHNSSLADINGSDLQAVQGMSLIPISRPSIVYAVLMLLLPFTPLVFTVYSLRELLSKLAQIVTG